MRNYKFQRLFLALSLLVTSYSLCVTNSSAEEQLTITTYYPSPSGSYNELGVNKLAVDINGVAVPSEYAAMNNGDAHIGRSLIVGAGGGSGFAYDELIGPPDNRPRDGSVLIKGSVGIGTATPNATLNVVTSTVSGGDPLANKMQIKAEGMIDGVRSIDYGRFWVQYGPQGAPLLVLEDYNDPPRIQFQQVGPTGTESTPQYSSWIGHARDSSNPTSDIAIMGGNVGIGTTDPQYTLHVVGTIQAGRDRTSATLNVGSAAVYGSKFSPVVAGAWGALGYDGGVIGGPIITDYIGVYGSAVSGYAGYFDGPITVAGDGLFKAGNVLRFGYPTDPAPKVWSPGSNGELDVEAPGSVFVRIQTDNVCSGCDAFRVLNGGTDPDTELFKVADDGKVTGVFGDYHVASDVRLKKDVVTIPDALQKVLALRGVNFRWKRDSDKGALQMGLIAQEVEKIVPEVVHTADDQLKTKAVEYQYLVALLVEAIKEQQKQIEELKTRNRFP